MAADHGVELAELVSHNLVPSLGSFRRTISVICAGAFPLINPRSGFSSFLCFLVLLVHTNGRLRRSSRLPEGSGERSARRSACGEEPDSRGEISNTTAAAGGPDRNRYDYSAIRLVSVLFLTSHPIG